MIWLLVAISPGCSGPTFPEAQPAAGPVDADGDGYSAAVDCDDADPGAGGPQAWLADSDRDGIPNVEVHTIGCDPGPDWVTATVFSAPDCDDEDPAVGDAVVHYFDLDGDGFGGSTYLHFWCGEPPPRWTRARDDCNDTDASISPGQVELCDGIDNDCSGGVDDNGACPPPLLWQSLDHQVTAAALLPSGEVLTLGEGRTDLHVVDPVTGVQGVHGLAFEPLHVAASPVGSLVAVASLTEIAWVELPSGKVQASTSLLLGPRDLVTADTGWTYVLDDSGILPLHATLGAGPRIVTSASVGVLHPSGTRLYVDADQRYEIETDGSLTLTRERRQSVEPLSQLVADPAGDVLYGRGSAYIVSDDPLTDMIYVGGPAPFESGAPPLSLSPSLQADRVFGVIGERVIGYQPSNLVVVGSVVLPSSSTGLPHVDEGFQFAAEATQQLVVVADVESGKEPSPTGRSSRFPMTSCPDWSIS